MKRTIKNLKPNELVSLVNSLYKLNEDNSTYIKAFLDKGTKTPSLEGYKKIIARATKISEDYSNVCDFEKCEKTMKSYLSASEDKLGYAELLVFTIEKVNKITLDYGDINEGYYGQIEDWYLTAAKLLVTLNRQGNDMNHMVERLQKVFESTKDIGWGYHDTLRDIFCEYLENI